MHFYYGNYIVVLFCLPPFNSQYRPPPSFRVDVDVRVKEMDCSEEFVSVTGKKELQIIQWFYTEYPAQELL